MSLLQLNTTAPSNYPTRVSPKDTDNGHPTASTKNATGATSINISNADINVVPFGQKSSETKHSPHAIMSSFPARSQTKISTKTRDTTHLDTGGDQPAPESTIASQGRSQSTSNEREVLKSRKLNVPTGSKKSALVRGKFKAGSQKPKSPSNTTGRVYSGLPPRLGHIQIVAFHKKLEASKALAQKDAKFESATPATPQPLIRSERLKAIDLMVSILLKHRGPPGLIKDYFWDLFSRQSLVMRAQFDEIPEKENFFVSKVLPSDASRHQVLPLTCFSYDGSLDTQYEKRISRISKFPDTSHRSTLSSTIHKFIG